MSPEQVFTKWKQKITKKDYAVFFMAVVAGFLTHMRVFVSDIPNHDGMSGIHFDQNMITSGRWFLRVACGISSDYTLPWLIGVLCVLYLAVRLKWHASWVQNVVRQFGLYLLWAYDD